MLRLRVRSESVEAVDDFDVAPEHVTCGAAKVRPRYFTDLSPIGE